MIASAQTAQLVHTSLGLAFAAERDLPLVVNRNAMPFGATAVKRGAILLDIIFRASSHQIVELSFGNLAQASAFAAGTHLHPLHHCAIELQLLFRRSLFGRHIRTR